MPTYGSPYRKASTAARPLRPIRCSPNGMPAMPNPAVSPPPSPAASARLDGGSHLLAEVSARPPRHRRLHRQAMSARVSPLGRKRHLIEFKCGYSKLQAKLRCEIEEIGSVHIKILLRLHVLLRRI